jgi:N-acyl-D-amino-acid deacylase
MTGLPAREFGIAQRGTLADGNFADLTIFDPQTIIDTATFEEPRQPAAGIEHVFVNGVSVWSDGKATGALPGAVLKPAASKTIVRSACGCGADHSAS